MDFLGNRRERQSMERNGETGQERGPTKHGENESSPEMGGEQEKLQHPSIAHTSIENIASFFISTTSAGAKETPLKAKTSLYTCLYAVEKRERAKQYR